MAKPTLLPKDMTPHRTYHLSKLTAGARKRKASVLMDANDLDRIEAYAYCYGYDSVSELIRAAIIPFSLRMPSLDDSSGPEVL